MSEKVSPIRRTLAGAKPGGGNKVSHLPPGCPVTPLGGDGKSFYYLNAVQQLVCLPAQQHSKNNITALFAPFTKDWCYQHYPKSFDKETGEPRDYKVDGLVVDLMNEAQAPGRSWEPGDNIHGRGIWPGPDGALRVHLGSMLIIGGKPRAPGVIDGRVYPLCPEWQGPAPDGQAAGEAGPAAELTALLECWNWGQPRLAPRLMLGWVLAALLCGALDWRPHVWLTAPRGSGKSTLLKMLGHLLQRDNYLLAAENASAASVRGKLGYDARPVMRDENEPSEDNRALNQVVDLLRLASSGGTVMRATVDQSVVEQTVRFVAICASVVRPALKSQDASRIAVLQLLRPSPGSVEPLLRPALLELLGRRLLRRALDGWKDWPEVLHAWRSGLAAQGLEARAQDQYGTLLALAWLAEQDGVPDTDSIEEWAVLAAELTQPDRAEERPEWFRLIETLAATTLRDEASRHDASVAELLETASYARRMPDPENGGWTYVAPNQARNANATLARHGMFFEPIVDMHGKPIRKHWHDESRAPCGQGDGAMLGYVAVANSHPILAQLLARAALWVRASSCARLGCELATAT